jgi:FixJ family two-component response regulator
MDKGHHIDSARTGEPRVFLADDEAEVRDAICFMLASRGLDCTAVECPYKLLELLSPAHRGCVLLDVRMPKMNGLELHRELMRSGITMPVVFISGHADVRMAVRAVQAGALDFLEKPFDNEQLLEKIDNAIELDGEAAARRTEKADVEARLATLTPREKEVMEEMLQGKLSKLIASDLAISVRTVEIHRANVLEKLQARNGSDLVRLVLSSPSYRDWLL